ERRAGPAGAHAGGRHAVRVRAAGVPMMRGGAVQSLVVLCLLSLAACGAADRTARATDRALRVCADPNNLPFSNERGEGFENRIAELVARDLGARVEYTWFAQRRGFIRNTLRAGECDVVMGVPSSFELALTTRPYYRSSYMFVTRSD